MNAMFRLLPHGDVLYSIRITMKLACDMDLSRKGILNFNSHADGTAVARPYGFEINFVRNPISGSAAWFFVIILKFILTALFESNFMKKIIPEIYLLKFIKTSTGKDQPPF